jgi:hypothetical protein
MAAITWCGGESSGGRERERERKRESLGERRQEAECCLSKHGEAADHPKI